MVKNPHQLEPWRVSQSTRKRHTHIHTRTQHIYNTPTRAHKHLNRFVCAAGFWAVTYQVNRYLSKAISKKYRFVGDPGKRFYVLQEDIFLEARAVRGGCHFLFSLARGMCACLRLRCMENG